MKRLGLIVMTLGLGATLAVAAMTIPPLLGWRSRYAGVDEPQPVDFRPEFVRALETAKDKLSRQRPAELVRSLKRRAEAAWDPNAAH